jgi:integrase/recombinase XerD
VGVESIADIRREHLEGYRGYLYESWWRGRRLSASTQSYRLSAVKCFLQFLYQERFLPFNLAEALDLPRTPKPLPPALLSEVETRRLLEGQNVSSPRGLRNRAMLELFYGTAIRNSELRFMLADEVDLERRELRLVGKGGKARVLPLGDTAMHWLALYLEKGRPRLLHGKDTRVVFVSIRGGTLHRAPISKIVRRAGLVAGLKKKVTPHLLRAACVTHMLRHGASLRHLQELLGHACLGTTQKYTRLDVSDLRRVVRECHPRERGTR